MKTQPCQSKNSVLNVPKYNLTALKWVLEGAESPWTLHHLEWGSGTLQGSGWCSLPVSSLLLSQVFCTSTGLPECWIWTARSSPTSAGCRNGRALQIKHQSGKRGHPGCWDGPAPSLNPVKADRQLCSKATYFACAYAQSQICLLWKWKVTQ